MQMPSDTVLIIGGGPAGLYAARSVADLGTPVVLVEKRDHLGGTPVTANYASFTPHLVDAEKMLKAKQFVRPSTGEPPKRVCFIQCVGSRDRRLGNEYCSKVCCGVASKEAIEIRRLLPDAKV